MGLVPYLPDGCMGKTVADNIIYSEQIANATSGATTIVLYCLSMRSVHNEVDILLWVTPVSYTHLTLPTILLV